MKKLFFFFLSILSLLFIWQFLPEKFYYLIASVSDTDIIRTKINGDSIHKRKTILLFFLGFAIVYQFFLIKNEMSYWSLLISFFFIFSSVFIGIFLNFLFFRETNKYGGSYIPIDKCLNIFVIVPVLAMTMLLFKRMLPRSPEHVKQIIGR